MVFNDNEIFNGTAGLRVLSAALSLWPSQGTELQEYCLFLNLIPLLLNCILEASY